MSNFTVPGCNRGGKSRHLNGGASLLVSRAPIESDEIGVWSCEQLLQMDTNFVVAMERAIALGLERRPPMPASRQRQREAKNGLACD